MGSVSDRKVWSSAETKSLLQFRLEPDMKEKFGAMKRNRQLWVELSEKMRREGHDRTASQCAVRWKNIMSAYKESREQLKSTAPDKKLCSFYKDIEIMLGDSPVSNDKDEMASGDITLGQTSVRLNAGQGTDSPMLGAAAVRELLNSRVSRTPVRKDVATLAYAVEQLRQDVNVQGQTLLRIEKTLTQILAHFEPATVHVPQDLGTVVEPVVVAPEAPAMLQEPELGSLQDAHQAQGSTGEHRTAAQEQGRGEAKESSPVAEGGSSSTRHVLATDESDTKRHKAM